MKFFVVCPCGCGCRFEVETPKRTSNVSAEDRARRAENMRRVRAELAKKQNEAKASK